MRKIFDLVLVLCLLAFLFWQKDKILYDFNFLTSGPCDRPITYKIGEVDSGYGISSSQFLVDLKDAGQIWDMVAYKNLFTYDPNGEITVNLIYSDRQAMADNLNNLDSQIKSNKDSLDSEKAQYQTEEADFEKRLSDFNSQVSYWNSKGGAPSDTYSQLVAEQAQLKAEADKLNNLARELNLSVKQYNTNVGQFNQNLGAYNQAITQRPEAGLYNGEVPKIDIYLTSSSKELIHTLAHEMGHALGLEHIDDPNSIMYPYTNEIIKPDTQEAQTLKDYCAEKNISLIINQIEENIKIKFNSKQTSK